MSNVSETLRYGSVVDSVINRVAGGTDRFGHSILEVIDKADQYSSIPDGTRRADLRLAPASVRAVVDAHISARLAGSPSLISVATHYLNPTLDHAKPAWESWGKKLTNTTIVGSVFDKDGNLLENYKGHFFGNLLDEIRPETYMLIPGAVPGTLVEIAYSIRPRPRPDDSGTGDQEEITTSIRPRPRPDDGECFLAGTMISMWDGTKKPIEQIRAGDIVVSYDKDGNRKPGRVTRTMTGDAKQILDVHGMMVTPGHATLCGDGRFAGQHVPILDILRSDGALVREDGTKIRAGTGCPLGTMGDRMIAAISGILDPDGSVQITGAGQIRAGTRFIKADGEDLSVLDLILKTGGCLTDSGMIQSGTDGPGVPFLWTFTPSLPRPEDYVLQRSGTDLHDIYQANEWEAVRPAMPVPAGGEAGATISRHPALIAAAPVNVPLAMRARPDAPKMSRKYRRAAEAKARRKGRTVH